MKELQEATLFKGPNLPLRRKQATSTSKGDWLPADKILDQKEEATFNKKRKRSVKVLYLVQWRGEPCSAASWEPKCNINAELFAEWTSSRKRFKP